MFHGISLWFTWSLALISLASGEPRLQPQRGTRCRAVVQLPVEAVLVSLRFSNSFHGMIFLVQMLWWENRCGITLQKEAMFFLVFLCRASLQAIQNAPLQGTRQARFPTNFACGRPIPSINGTWGPVVPRAQREALQCCRTGVFWCILASTCDLRRTLFSRWVSHRPIREYEWDIIGHYCHYTRIHIPINSSHISFISVSFDYYMFFLIMPLMLSCALLLGICEATAPSSASGWGRPNMRLVVPPKCQAVDSGVAWGTSFSDMWQSERYVTVSYHHISLIWLVYVYVCMIVWVYMIVYAYTSIRMCHFYVHLIPFVEPTVSCGDFFRHNLEALWLAVAPRRWGVPPRSHPWRPGLPALVKNMGIYWCSWECHHPKWSIFQTGWFFLPTSNDLLILKVIGHQWKSEIDKKILETVPEMVNEVGPLFDMTPMQNCRVTRLQYCKDIGHLPMGLLSQDSALGSQLAA